MHSESRIIIKPVQYCVFCQIAQVRYAWKRLVRKLGGGTITRHLGIDRVGKTASSAFDACTAVKTQTKSYFSPILQWFFYYALALCKNKIENAQDHGHFTSFLLGASLWLLVPATNQAFPNISNLGNCTAMLGKCSTKL